MCLLFNVFVWFVCGFACVVVWRVWFCDLVLFLVYCVVMYGLLLCVACLFVSLPWFKDVLCDDAWFVSVFVFVCFVQCVCVWCLWNAV